MYKKCTICYENNKKPSDKDCQSCDDELLRLEAENDGLKSRLDFEIQKRETVETENERLSELTCVNCGEKFLSPTGSELYEKIVLLKAENEELKEELELNTANAVVIEMAERLNKLKKALEEVREIINSYCLNMCNGCSSACINHEIEDKINEVLKDENH